MKRVDSRIFKALMLVVALALGATSCEKEPYAEVPGSTTIECKAGDNPTLSFTAGDKWQLSSNATWCKFITSAGAMQNMAGEAGSHTITFEITDDNNGNNWSTAEITMKMGGNTGVIATIKRHPKELYMKLSDISQSPQKAFTLGYVDYVPMYIDANFRFAATYIPDWVDVKQINEETKEESLGSITGVPGESSYVQLRIVNDGERERYPITADEGYVIKFSNEDGDINFEFPIVYLGMGDNKISFVGPTEQNYGWEVSLDGKEFRQHDESNNTTTKYSNELEFDIISHNDEFDILYIEQRRERGMPSFALIGSNAYDKTNEKNSWMHFDKERMTLTIDDGNTTRYGLVMALPRGVYNKIRANIDEYIYGVDGASGIDLPTINDDYKKYVIIELTQRDFAEQDPYAGMHIYHSITTLDIAATEYTSSSVMEEYGVSEAYTCPFVNSIEGKKPGIVINPRIEGWDTLNFEEGNATAELYHNGKQLKMSDDEYYVGENTNEEMAIYLWGPKDGWQSEDVHIIFKVGGVAKKLLVVTPPAM